MVRLREGRQTACFVFVRIWHTGSKNAVIGERYSRNMRKGMRIRIASTRFSSWYGGILRIGLEDQEEIQVSSERFSELVLILMEKVWRKAGYLWVGFDEEAV